MVASRVAYCPLVVRMNTKRVRGQEQPCEGGFGTGKRQPVSVSLYINQALVRLILVFAGRWLQEPFVFGHQEPSFYASRISGLDILLFSG